MFLRFKKGFWACQPLIGRVKENTLNNPPSPTTLTRHLYIIHLINQLMDCTVFIVSQCHLMTISAEKWRKATIDYYYYYYFDNVRLELRLKFWIAQWPVKR